MIEMYDLKGEYICTFDSYLECAKYFNTTRNIIRTYISLSKKGTVSRKRDVKNNRWVRLYKKATKGSDK